MFPILDMSASPEQREALLHVVSSRVRDQGASFFQVFSATYGKVHRPVLAGIALGMSAEGCKVQLKTSVKLAADSDAMSEMPACGGDEVEITLAHKFEDILAAIGIGWTQDLGSTPLNLVSPISISDYALIPRLNIVQTGLGLTTHNAGMMSFL